MRRASLSNNYHQFKPHICIFLLCTIELMLSICHSKYPRLLAPRFVARASSSITARCIAEQSDQHKYSNSNLSGQALVFAIRFSACAVDQCKHCIIMLANWLVAIACMLSHSHKHSAEPHGRCCKSLASRPCWVRKAITVIAAYVNDSRRGLVQRSC